MNHQQYELMHSLPDTSIPDGKSKLSPVMIFHLYDGMPWISANKISSEAKGSIYILNVSCGAVRSAASSYAAMRTVVGSRPVLVIV